jgi:hypothetical protein
VVKLAQFPPSELLQKIKESSSGEAQSVAMAYAALLAMTQKNLNTSELLALPILKNLEWAPALLALHNSATTSTSTASFVMPTASVNGAVKPPVAVHNAVTFTRVSGNA